MNPTVNYHLNDIIAVLKKKNYQVFENDKRNYNLNIVGIRTADATPDTFNDNISIFWKYNNQWRMLQYAITTDPGLFYLNSPENALGTAILKEGQMSGSFGVGLHKGKYEALVQTKPVTVIRDANRDNYLDFSSGKPDTGMFGIHIHGSKYDGTSLKVGSWSAGCQVFKNWADFQQFMTLCKQAIALYGPSLTYTLINQKDFTPSV